MNNDLISRQAAIVACTKTKVGAFPHDAGVNNSIEALKALPSAQQWISCAERLPEENVNVLIWFEYFRYGDYNRLFQAYGLSYVYCGKWSGFINGESGWRQMRVIAWMPLPEPWKEVEA